MAPPGAPEVTRTALEAAAAALAHRLVMWKGPDLSGRDVDLLALDGAEVQLGDLLRERGWSRGPAEPGHVVWAPPAPGEPEIDVVPESAWPPWYPPATQVAARAVAVPGLPPVAAPVDVLAVAAADAVSGRPLEKVARRVRSSLGAIDEVGDRALAALVADPDRLLARGRRGRLPWRAALALAARSPAARGALGARAREAVARRRRRGALVAFSGMDGSGKSTATAAALDVAHASGFSTTTAWVRLVDSDTAALERIARPMRRLLRHRGRIADTSAVSGPTEVQTTAPKRGPVATLWVIAIALVTARSLRLAARPRRRGAVVVADRWTLDAIVDLRVRYGPHPVAEAVLRTLAPRRALAVLLEIDAETAASRKPGDQTLRTLERMEAIYGELASTLALQRVDARRPAEEVAAAVREIVQWEMGSR